MESELCQDEVKVEMQSKRTDSLDGMKKRTSKTAYHCEFCGKSFSHHIASHKRIHTGEKPYHCEICGKFFSANYTLTNHKRIHTEKRYHCEMCGKSFSRRHHIASHKHIHTGEKPYHCEICDESFSQKSDLTAHVGIHTEKTEVICRKNSLALEWEIFGKLFLLKKVRTGETPYHCDVCGKSFSQCDSLTKHHRIHTEEKPYPCDICGKSFSETASNPAIPETVI
ncbi:zinc finger protein 708 [Octopus bimaculoides]|uniref:zinc finger protein 708 n=1 Tax=Octopus bimaculoides TaxID=37653 RepID=UPI0022E8BA11|nr:zinc finger protein 708 [Octopus bimaculoides]